MKVEQGNPTSDLFSAIDSLNYIKQGDSINNCFILTKVRESINQGANLKSKHPLIGLPPLSMAIKNGSIELVELLLDLNADPNFSGEGMHPLLLASNNLPEAVGSLLKHNVDLYTKIDGNPLWLAVTDSLSKQGLKKQSDEIMEIAASASTEDSEKYLKKYHKLFNEEILKRELTSEKNESRIHFLKKLAETGSTKRFIKPNLDFDIQSLYEKFPNFSDTLDIISEQTALGQLSQNAVFAMRPILLVGPPGVGKTRFIREIAKQLGFEFNTVNCGGITAGFVLSGSSVSWSDGRPGAVHTALRDGQTANPIIMLDEIDKLSGDQRFSGYGPMYQLLDRESAKDFSDEAVGVPIDCSYVTWVATANSTDPIPEAILSRFRVIEVKSPNKNQMIAVINSIYSDILEENKESWGPYFSKEINDDMINALEENSPREIVHLILSAVGRAAKSRGQIAVSGSELLTLQADDFKEEKKKQVKFGF